MDTSANRLYDLYGAGNLGDGAPWTPLGLNQPGTGGTLWLQVTNGQVLRFYRCTVTLP